MNNQFQQSVTALGGLGRFGDTYMVHASEGETIIPMEILNRSPILKNRLFKTMRDMGINPERYIVGNKFNSINPITGQPEFFLKKVFDKAKKVVQKVMPGKTENLLPLLAAAVPGMGPWATAALGAGIGSLTHDDTTKGMLRGALLGTGGRYLAGGKGGFSAGKAYAPSLSNIMPQLQGIPSALKKSWGEGMLGKIGRTLNPFAETGQTLFGPAGDRKTLAKWGPLLGSLVGTAGFLSKKDDQPIQGKLVRYNPTTDPLRNLQSGNQAFVDLLQNLGLPIADQNIYSQAGIGLGAQGGVVQAYRNGGFPRKTGQINGPGTGTSDSIKAMLSDGEFVMTAKAVRHAGGGDRRDGARKMYKLMHNLEQGGNIA